MVLASALFVLGSSYIYSITSSTNLVEIADLITHDYNLQNTFVLGSILITIALLFKIGAVPFHLWLPDAYQGASFYVFSFLIIFPKIFLFYLLFSLNQLFGNNVIIIIACILTGIVGSIQAVIQTKIKRFIAYTVIFNNAFFLSLILLSGFSSVFNLLNSLLCYILVSVLTLFPLLITKNSTTNLRFHSLSDLLVYEKLIFLLFSSSYWIF